MLTSLLVALLLLQATPEAPKPADAKPSEKASEKDEAAVVTHHEIRMNGKTLKYTATAGMMPIRDAKGDTDAHIFFMAYTLDGRDACGRRDASASLSSGR